MNAADVQLEAGGLLPINARVDAKATEEIVARSYRHPALGQRPVVRLASNRLGQAEDLAMEFLGFAAPEVSEPVGVQQRRSLGFAQWALINDPTNARYALDLVKRMKKTARQARSKPGHAWDAYTEMAKDLGRSARHFLPPFWEEAGRAFKEHGNQTYAGRALNKSLESERVHALESDKARRRDVVLEFVLSGCLAGNALSDYGNDLQSGYPPAEAFAIFRDLCIRRTSGGMAPWGAMPKDLARLAKAAGLNGDEELEKFLEEVIDAPAMGRAPYQFWSSCSKHCKRIVARNSAFAVALLRHTRPEKRYYGESKLPPWLDLLEEWGVFPFVWEDQHRGAPPLGEPIALWFSRIIGDEVPAPRRTLDMFQKLTPRLKKEGVPLPLAMDRRNRGFDIDLLEACLKSGIKIDDPPSTFSVSFAGWLAENVDHPLRNQDILLSGKDDRFEKAVMSQLEQALQCRGGQQERGYRETSLQQRAFPLAAAERPGITELWRRQTAEVVAQFEDAGLASFEIARNRFESTFWPAVMRLFPDLAKRLNAIEPSSMLQRTLQAGIFDEYGMPGLEEAIEQSGIEIKTGYRETNIFLTFPTIVLTDKVHAYVIHTDGTVKKREMHLPPKAEVTNVVVVGDDLAISYRDEKYQGHFHWVSDPGQTFDAPAHYYHSSEHGQAAALADGSFFLGVRSVRPGDKQMPEVKRYLHDGQRFWTLAHEYNREIYQHIWKVEEVDPQTGKQMRASVPAWFEDTENSVIDWSCAVLMPTPPGIDDSPLGAKNGMLGWKVIQRRDGGRLGVGMDGRNREIPRGTDVVPAAMLRQPGTNDFLPVSSTGSVFSLFDVSGTTIIARLVNFETEFAEGQACVLPLIFWHLLKLRDEASSKKLRAIRKEDCAALMALAAEDRAKHQATIPMHGKEPPPNPLAKLLPAVKKLLPTAPERLAMGVARIIERAEAVGAAFVTLRDGANADAGRDAVDSDNVVYRKSDQAAEQWGLETYFSYGHEEKTSVSANLAAAAAFLRGEKPAGVLPRTKHCWFAMLENLPIRCWQTLWRAAAAEMNQKVKTPIPWLDFLKFWQECGIGQLPGQMDLMNGHPTGAKVNAWGGFDIDKQGGRSYSLHNETDRFIVIEYHTHHNTTFTHQFLRYSTAKTPGNPPGFTITSVRRIQTKLDPQQITAFVAAVEGDKALPLPTRAELAETANRLGISPAEIGLIWIGGLNLESHQNNFLPTELRTALGLKATEASAGRQALRNLDASLSGDLYQAVVAEGLTLPFAADRGPVLRSIETTWRSKTQKRLQLDAALQTRLSALGKASRWNQIYHHTLLEACADPAAHPAFEPGKCEIQVVKISHRQSLEVVASNQALIVNMLGFLRSIAHLVAIIHAETPAGTAARQTLPALIEQTTRLIDHSHTLLLLREIYLYGDANAKGPKPSEWLDRYVGKTAAGAKDGAARYDDGFVVAAALDSDNKALVAFRPASLKSDGDLARLVGILSAGALEANLLASSPLPIIAAIKSPGFQKLAKAIPAANLSDGQWPQNPLHTAPKIVAQIRTKHKLSDEAAILYSQLLAVPDPTTANVCTWNGWSAAQFKKAAAELVAGKLVLEATRARGGRSIFLPGEWSELKAPWLPIESWKLAHLGEFSMNWREPCPLGGPLVLRPFEDLFAAAWNRVVDGDEPRYEEVKRKKKTK